MFAVFYILISFILGGSVSHLLLNGSPERSNKIWIFIPASFGTGILLMTWISYITAWLLHVKFHIEGPLLYADAISAIVSMVFALVLITISKGRSLKKSSYITEKRLFVKESIIYVLLFAFILFTMFYVFFQKGDRLYSGVTVFGDYAPHTAMMRSFSREANFPTRYPHFGGEDIKYHFMFQFLVGNLEFLGMRIDIAYNIVSAFSLCGFLIVISRIAFEFSSKLSSLILTFVFFFFRSGTAFFRFCMEHYEAGDLMETLRNNSAFIGYTPNENWGLWNYNVYLNQRHLGFGLLIASVILWLFMDHIAVENEDKGLRWVKDQLLSIKAWAPEDPAKALACGLILGLTSFWNGACVIGILLILFGIAIFADGKTDFMILAAITVAVSFFQTKWFIWGNAVSPAIQTGFICEDKSFTGIILYIFQITGISILGLIPLLIVFERKERLLAVSLFVPVIFTFTVSLTADVTVNHKYIMISMAFAAALWAALISKMLSGGWCMKTAALILVLCLTANGFYDFVVIIKGDGPGRRAVVNTDSELTEWLNDNLTSEDLILTPEYSMNEVTLSGVMMYLGWPYYAWSAGYDTYERADVSKEIYSTWSTDRIKELVDKGSIDYILFEDGMSLEEEECHESTIAETYKKVYETEDGRIRIYDTKDILF